MARRQEALVGLVVSLLSPCIRRRWDAATFFAGEILSSISRLHWHVPSRTPLWYAHTHMYIFMYKYCVQGLQL